MRGTEKSALGIGNSTCKAWGERKHGTFEREEQGFEYEEVTRAVTRLLSWGQAHEVLELCLVWGFRVAWRWEGLL